MKLKVSKWANSAAVRLPAPVLAQLGAQVGDELDGEVVRGALVLRPAVRSPAAQRDAALEAMKYALNAEEGMAFLQCWLHGNFSAIRKEWPDAPEAVFVGADPMHKTP